MTSSATHDWTFDKDVFAGTASSLIGYSVEASDGAIGDVTEESTTVGSSYIVVDTGFWILEKKRLVPASAVTAVDHESETIRLAMAKDEVKGAPDYVPESDITEDEHHDAHDIYYRPYFGNRT